MEIGLISALRENLLDLLELGQVLSTYDGDLRDPLLWSQERPVPAGVQPRWIQGIRRVDGVGVERLVCLLM